MRDLWLTAYGHAVTCRVAQESLKLNVSRDLLTEMVLEALGRISNDSDLKLESVTVTRSGFKAQFVANPSLSEMSVLQLRSSRRATPGISDGVKNYGGTFKKVRHYLGLYYMYITKEPEAEESVSPIEIPRNAAVQKSSFNATPRSVGSSPVCDRKRELYKTLFDDGMDDHDRKRELYKTLFDEGMDDHDRSESLEKPAKNSPKAITKKVSPRNSSITNSESKSSSEERTPVKQKSRDSGAKCRPVAGAAKEDDTYIPVGGTGGSLTYSPSKIGKRNNGAEYIPEYIPTIKEKRNLDTNGVGPAQYVPSKIRSEPTTKDAYDPTEIKSKSRSRTLKTSKNATYKPSRKRSPEVNEYVPAVLTSQTVSGMSYKPASKKINRLIGAPDSKASEEEAYEPSGATDPQLQYRPSQVTTLASQNPLPAEPHLQLRTVRRKRIEASPEKAGAQKRLRHHKASAPEKCLMSDLMFGWTKENHDRIDKKTYTDREIAQLEAEISRLKSLKNLTECHIRYLFYKLEPEIISVAVGKPLRQRHILFMREQNSLLDNAIPITAVTPTQLDLIKKLCMDHFNREHGFNIFYILQVLLPEVIIRMHMRIHGTTYEESDKQTDIGIVNLYKTVSRRGLRSLESLVDAE